MGYAPVSDGFHTHAKVLALGADIDAVALWTLALSWSTQHGTDGVVPPEVVDKLLAGTHHRTRSRLVSALLRVGLWEVDRRYTADTPPLEGSMHTPWTPDTGSIHDRKKPERSLKDDAMHGVVYAFHDFLDWQRSRNELEELRRKKRLAGSLGGRRKAMADATARAIAESKQKLSTAIATPRLSSSLHVTSRLFTGEPAVDNSPGAAPPDSSGVALAPGPDSSTGAAQPTAPLADPACAEAGPNGTGPPGSRYEAILERLRAQHPEWPQPTLASEALNALSRAVAAERRT